MRPQSDAHVMPRLVTTLASRKWRAAKREKYALEIAADISYPTIRVLVRVLRWLWHRIYDGIELHHASAARGRERQGSHLRPVPSQPLRLPAAWLRDVRGRPASAAHRGGHQSQHAVVGGILRRGGAFFLRRSFKGNRLYAAVFDAYIHQILVKGHSMEYFVEGGRSRTGRLLQPKGGMLAMTVNSYVKNPERPIVFVPVYFGYEKLIEGDSFISELGGARRKRNRLAA